MGTLYFAEHVYKVEVTNPRSFGDWIVFLLGGALGAVIVLGFERLLDSRKDSAKKKHIERAMDLEIDDNVRLNGQIIANIASDDKMPYIYNRFSTVWMDKYLERCIDYGNEDSTRLQSFLYGAKALIHQIHTTVDMLAMLHATSKMLVHFTDHIQSYNKNIMANAQELNPVLASIKDLRKGNKIHKKDVDTLNSLGPTTQASDNSISKPKKK